MHKIVIANQCACVKKSDLKNNLTFESKDEALSEALKINEYMNENFCKKHTFEVQEVFNNFMIRFYTQRLDSCCGNGCCM